MNHPTTKESLPHHQKKLGFNLPPTLKEGLKLVLVVATSIIVLAVMITQLGYNSSITPGARYQQLLETELATQPLGSSEEAILETNPVLAELSQLLTQRKVLQFAMNDLTRSPAPMQIQGIEYKRKRYQQQIQRIEQRISYLLEQQEATYAKR
ncbi:MAG: hypothetical protein AAGE93_25660 [Bacteroidota bacterium]